MTLNRRFTPCTSGADGTLLLLLQKSGVVPVVHNAPRAGHGRPPGVGVAARSTPAVDVESAVPSRGAAGQVSLTSRSCPLSKKSLQSPTSWVG